MEFNLTSEPWIPCAAGGYREVSLREAIVEAHRIERISDASPLVSISLYRFLLALTHRLYGPESDIAWKRIWDRGRFDTTKLDDYFGEWRNRFDLFDAEYPFYQDPAVSPYVDSGRTTLSILKQELARGPLLFDHTVDSECPPVTPSEAARLLITCNNFDLDPRGAGGFYMTSGLLSEGVLFMNAGANLFETLVLNMINYPSVDVPPISKPQDAPAWEKDRSNPVERLPEGYLDWLTWQSRRMLLLAEENSQGIHVNGVIRTAGDRVLDGFSDGNPAFHFDPMFAFRLNDKPAAGGKPWEPLKMSGGKSLWRDFFALFQSVGAPSNRRPPTVISRVSELAEDGHFDKRLLPVETFALDKDRAKVNRWSQERFSLPLSYLSDDNLAFSLQQSLSAVESIGDCLSSAMKELLDNGRPDVDRFWSEMESRFREYAIDLASDGAVMNQFLIEARRLALFQFRKAARVSGVSGEFLCREAVAERRLADRIGKVIRKTVEVSDG